MTIQSLARAAHQINKAYCESIGDHSQVDWEQAPEWQKESAIVGVQFHINNPNATPEDSHKEWFALKESQGWKYGPVKDPEKKEHPCMVSYEQLDQSQRSKDYLFRAVVHNLLGYLL